MSTKRNAVLFPPSSADYAASGFRSPRIDSIIFTRLPFLIAAFAASTGIEAFTKKRIAHLLLCLLPGCVQFASAAVKVAALRATVAAGAAVPIEPRLAPGVIVTRSPENHVRPRFVSSSRLKATLNLAAVPSTEVPVSCLPCRATVGFTDQMAQLAARPGRAHLGAIRPFGQIPPLPCGNALALPAGPRTGRFPLAKRHSPRMPTTRWLSGVSPHSPLHIRKELSRGAARAVLGTALRAE